MDINKRVKELEERIVADFPAIPYPGDDNLVEAFSLVDPDARDLLSAVKGRTWQEAAPLILTIYLSSSIVFFTPEGYQYYLPAYLMFLLHWEGGDVLGEAVIDSLVPYCDQNGCYRKERNGLNEKQISTIDDVFAVLRERFRDGYGPCKF